MVFSYCGRRLETYAFVENITFRASVMPRGVRSAVKPVVLDTA
jgi:hypothetical protein